MIKNAVILGLFISLPIVANENHWCHGTINETTDQIDIYFISGNDTIKRTSQTSPYYHYSSGTYEEMQDWGDTSIFEGGWFNGKILVASSNSYVYDPAGSIIPTGTFINQTNGIQVQNFRFSATVNYIINFKKISTKVINIPSIRSQNKKENKTTYSLNGRKASFIKSSGIYINNSKNILNLR